MTYQSMGERYRAPWLATAAMVIFLLSLGQLATANDATAMFPTGTVRITPPSLMARDSDGRSYEPITVQVEIAATDAARRQGLMFREELAQDHGMWFEFETVAPVSMWMKNTYIPLDILFVSERGKIISIAKNTTPLSRRLLASGGAIKFVLEVNAGFAERHGIRKGDFIKRVD